MNGLEYIKNVDGTEKKSVLEQYFTKETKFALNENIISQLKLENFVKESDKLKLPKISEVFIQIFHPNGNIIEIGEVQYVFEKFLDILEKKSKAGEISDIEKFNDTKNLFDNQIKISDGVLYLVGKNSNQKILNLFIQYLINSYRVKFLVKPIKNIRGGSSSPKNFRMSGLDYSDPTLKMTKL